jgi:hypothetical protein
MVRLSTSSTSSSTSDPQQGVSTASIPAGGSQTVTATIALSTAGAYYAHVYVDNYSALTQSNTSNDIYHHSQAITVTAVAVQPPDLVVQGVTLGSRHAFTR